jgi:hypothetical protein
MGGVLFSGVRSAANILSSRAAYSRGGPALEETFDPLDNLTGRSRRMDNASKLAAVPHAVSKPASELLHFAYTIGQVGSINLPIVARK